MNYLFGIRGRVGRLQWWGGQAIVWTIIIGTFLWIGLSLKGLDSSKMKEHMAQSGTSILLVVAIASVLCAWINIATTVKRYHDRNKSGVWFFVAFVPFIGGIWQMFECGFLSGLLGSNNYGSRDSSNTHGDLYGSTLEEARLNSLDAKIEAMRRESAMNAGRQQDQSRTVVRTRREPSEIGRIQPAGFGKRGR
ncbi:DUF805 domain-containing protein [Pararhizobium sp.]|uniref:DUF805 domain-containing protein n=1 Tax=Pararhizobium sp. TaxID=1977563 RepID=UPI002727FE8C|nr:DUF805 domain-containing protein [Pararhizobium sp.]MDO9414716.1 DUF805 domain-containing protein [Pararhizobium sp.]